MNIPAILSLFKVARNPPLCLPHFTVTTFDQLPIPLSSAFKRYGSDEKGVEIKAVVLDKDNCFAIPNSNDIHPPYSEKFKALIETYSPSNILVVSNSSGLNSTDPDGSRAEELERKTGVKVLRHTTRKPACGPEIMAHFKDRVTSPREIAVVGDRLFTDVVMANMMGSYSIWIRRGVVPDHGLVTRLEYGVYSFLIKRGYDAVAR